MKRVTLLALLLLLYIYSHAATEPTFTDKQAKNLYAFAKAYGYVKYFYPIKNKESINWNLVAATGARNILNAPNDTILQQELAKLFSPLAPLLMFHFQSEKPFPNNLTTTVTGNYYYNLHKGLGQDKDDLPLLTRKLIGSLYQSTIVEVDRGSYSEQVESGSILSVDSVYTAKITDNLLCSLPLTVTEQAFNGNINYKQFTKKYKLNLSNQQDQLATIVIFWNVFQHFHPYLDYTIGWDKVFFETIAELSPSMSEKEFIQAASNITSSLNDGHASLSYTNSTGIYKRAAIPAIETGWVEGKLIVTESNIAEAALQQGDIIEAVNSTKTEELIDQLKKRLSYANEKNGNLLAAEKILNSYMISGNAVTLHITDNLGNKKEFRLDPKSYWLKKTHSSKPIIYEAEKGIYYIDASRISEKDIKANHTALKQAKGIVIDMRNRPNSAFTTTVLPYFINKELQTGNWSVPNYTFPDQQRVNYKPVAGWRIKPNGENIAAPKAFLVNHRTFSYGETCAEIVDHYNLGTIVGGHTAGTNGNINFAGAGKLQVLWTGLKVLKRDGSRYHGVGVEPDILVQPTIAGILEKKDEALERAILFVESGK
ncbi:hypothetical protein JAO76_11635 [Pontibacter sp. BT310]|uniref:Tail specific protease domain-containing protein n=1 Tax=Pontibacter populi TaxID=890055 RepID=A0ABS6XCL6_9BACT|nr:MULTISPECIES: S41 family peptidase [Pontibacter]MBJ6118850.1 hypothetical protein [Pontibacter sp. BT310]MBR0571278.1 hypothetical protein [Microvirga sp. STS03]MBW3365704.1 hypothetical protein [Pontibacter populi]